MKKRMLSLLLAVCMLVSLLPVGMLSVSAAEVVEYNYMLKAVAEKINADTGTTSFKDTTTFTEAQALAVDGCAPFWYVNRGATFNWNGQLFMNGSNGATTWTLFRITVGEDGAYRATVNYEGFGAQSSPGAVYIAPTLMSTLADVIAAGDTYKAADIERVVSGSVSATSPTNLVLQEGTYNLWFYQDGSAGTDDEKHRYIAFDNIVLTKVSEIPVEVTISGAPESLEKGETATLTASVSPSYMAQSVTWESSDNSVATVENGVVTAVGKGTVTITATATDGTKDSESVTIKVTAPDLNYNFKAVGEYLYSGSHVDLKDGTTMSYENAAAAGSDLWKYKTRGAYMSYNGTDLYLNGTKGGTSYIALTIDVDESGVYSGKFLYDVWSSSSPAAIYIAPTGTVAGSAQTAEYCYFNLLGSNTAATDWVANSTKNMVLTSGEYDLWICQVAEEDDDRYVVIKNLQLYKESDIPVESVTISGAPATLEKGATATLTATVLPEEAPQTITWDSLNKDVASVDENGVVTGLKDGTATITATAGDKTASVTIKIVTILNYQIQAFAATLSDTSILNTGVTAEQTADFGGWSFTGARNTSVSYNGKTFLGNGYYGINITISESGIYQAKMIYDTMSSSCDGAVYIAPAGVNNSTIDQYKVVDIPWATTDGDDLVAVGRDDILLKAGNYTVYFQGNASYSGGSYTNPETGAVETGNRDRYLVIDELQLYKVGEYSTADYEAGLTGPSGCSIRYTAPAGQRFLSSISKEVASQVVEFGTIMVPTTLLGENELTHDTERVAVVKAEKIYGYTENEILFTAVLVKISASLYGREITARPYAILADGTVIYGSAHSDSILGVAEKIIAEDREDEKQAVKDAAQMIIDGEELPYEAN